MDYFQFSLGLCMNTKFHLLFQLLTNRKKKVNQMTRGSKLEEIMSIMYKVVEKIFDQISCGLGPLSSSLDGEISRKRNLKVR